jgi:hypothetical protein
MPAPHIPKDEWPGLRRVYARPEKYSKWPTEFYGNLDNFQEYKKSLFHIAEQGDDEGADKMMDDDAIMAKISMSLPFTRASRSLQSMHREMHRLKIGVLDPHATSKERFNSMERIRVQRNELMKMMVEMANRELKEAKANQARRNQR